MEVGKDWKTLRLEAHHSRKTLFSLKDLFGEDWHRVIDVNLYGVIHGVQAAYPVMLRQGFGHIVNTASLAGLISGPGMAIYSVTKHSVVTLSETLYHELDRKSVV